MKNPLTIVLMCVCLVLLGVVVALSFSGQQTYCQRCGMVPNATPVKCVGSHTTHDFVSGPKSIHCRRCGVLPCEKPPKCSGGHTTHDWID